MDEPVAHWELAISRRFAKHNEGKMCLHISTNRLRKGGIKRNAFLSIFSDELDLTSFLLYYGIMEKPLSEEHRNYISPFIKPESEPDQVELTTADNSIETVLPQLDFHETGELNEAKQAVLIALYEESDDPSRLRTAWTEYAIIGEQIVDNADITSQRVEPRAKMQLALIIHKAFIFREAQRIPRYIELLDHAETYANAIAFYTIASTLGHELESITNNSELSPESFLAKLKGEMSEIDRERLRDLSEAGASIEDLIDAARDTLQKEQHNTERNPDVVLTELGIIKPKD